MIELTDEQKHTIAIALLSDQQVEEYAAACHYMEQGMELDDAIEAAQE